MQNVTFVRILKPQLFKQLIVVIEYRYDRDASSILVSNDLINRMISPQISCSGCANQL